MRIRKDSRRRKHADPREMNAYRWIMLSALAVVMVHTVFFTKNYVFFDGLFLISGAYVILTLFKSLSEQNPNSRDLVSLIYLRTAPWVARMALSAYCLFVVVGAFVAAFRMIQYVPF